MFIDLEQDSPQVNAPIIPLPETVYLVLCEPLMGNEPGMVLSIWTDKEAAERERDRLRDTVPVNRAWAYEVNDAPLNKQGVSQLN